MAYMDQTTKKQIAAELKKVIPAGWKYSVAVDNHSTIVLTIASAPVDLYKIAKGQAGYGGSMQGHVQINPHCMDKHFEKTEVADVMAKVQKVLYGCGYYDDSDLMTDYFNCAYYVHMQIGKWDKPFVCTAA